MAKQAPKPAKYQRRRPELTPCFKIVNEHLDSFVQARESENRPLPQYVIDEFEAFIKCGIPGYGFLRLKCGCCGEEKIVAFSCKKRGFSCLPSWRGRGVAALRGKWKQRRTWLITCSHLPLTVKWCSHSQFRFATGCIQTKTSSQKSTASSSRKCTATT